MEHFHFSSRSILRFNSRSRHLSVSVYYSTCLPPIGAQNRSLSCRITLQEQNTHDEALFKAETLFYKTLSIQERMPQGKGQATGITGSPRQVKKGGPNCCINTAWLHHTCWHQPGSNGITQPPRAHQLAKAHHGHAAIPKVAKMAGKERDK